MGFKITHWFYFNAKLFIGVVYKMRITYKSRLSKEPNLGVAYMLDALHAMVKSTDILVKF